MPRLPRLRRRDANARDSLTQLGLDRAEVMAHARAANAAAVELQLLDRVATTLATSRLDGAQDQPGIVASSVPLDPDNVQQLLGTRVVQVPDAALAGMTAEKAHGLAAYEDWRADAAAHHLDDDAAARRRDKVADSLAALATEADADRLPWRPPMMRCTLAPVYQLDAGMTEHTAAAVVTAAAAALGGPCCDGDAVHHDGCPQRDRQQLAAVLEFGLGLPPGITGGYPADAAAQLLPASYDLAAWERQLAAPHLTVRAGRRDDAPDGDPTGTWTYWLHNRYGTELDRQTRPSYAAALSDGLDALHLEASGQRLLEVVTTGLPA